MQSATDSLYLKYFSLSLLLKAIPSFPQKDRMDTGSNFKGGRKNSIDTFYKYAAEQNVFPR